MRTGRLSLLGIAAAFVLGACSSSGATTTAVTPAAVTAAPTTEATTKTSVAPTTAPPTTAAPGATTAAATEATVDLVSKALVSQTGGKLSPADATCIASGLLAKYDLNQLAAMQSGADSAEAVAATSVVIAECVGTDRAAEVGALLAAAS